MKIIPNYPRGEILPVFKTELKSSRGETSLRVERVTTFKSFLIDDRGNFTPGRNLTCDGPQNLNMAKE